VRISKNLVPNYKSFVADFNQSAPENFLNTHAASGNIANIPA